ncbi:winged helix-turn-helix domain-containing protein [Microcoleus sp. A006_D1]|uniref:winged helix-turn-helix domain-containing protein n=1 Tax=Microcoleus sp. A006_D1 TaxID=3055267 RepID=UPI002FD4599C
MPVSTKIKEPVLPPIVVDPGSPITMAAQITEQIKLLIVLGKLQPNQVLPPLARLAEHLGISNSTITAVYNELIASGYLVAHRGKGTFIADSPLVAQLTNRKHFYDLLGEAFNAASQFGITAAEFSAAAYAKAAIQDCHKLSVVFVNFFPDTIDITQSLQLETGLSVQSIDRTKLQAQDSQALEQTLAADLIVTSIKNIWDVAQLIPSSSKEIIGIDVNPNVQLLSRISALSRNAKVLFVSPVQDGSEVMKQMVDYSINHIKSMAVTLKCFQKTQKLQEFDLVICSPPLKNQLTQYVLDDKLMTFGIAIDPLNLLVLQARLAAIGREKLL